VATELRGRIEIIATRGPQPLAELEGVLGQAIHLVDGNGRLNWEQLGISVPDLFIHTGWASTQFNCFAREVKRGGGMVVCMVDNIREHNLRQAVGRYVFRLVYRPHIDRVLVPGKSTQELMVYLGVPSDQIHAGLYGGDREVFTLGPNLSQRRRNFLFVGQFIERKGIPQLIKAVRELRLRGHEFNIAAVGAGPMQQNLVDAEIPTVAFSKAANVAELMQESRFLVLPSVMDHWGVVVHEAALCGCGLVLSQAVGSHADLLTPKNGFLADKAHSLSDAMEAALTSDQRWLEGCYQESQRLANAFGPDRWFETFTHIYNRLYATPCNHSGVPFSSRING
jgi:glycosyltransferase involved in cell wall biosynthesis